MKRAMDVLWPIIGLSAVAFSSWVLLRELKGLKLADVGAGLALLTPLNWLLAAFSAAVAYSALAWYDQIALAHLGRRLPTRFVALVSFTTYALAHNIGASVFSGALVRYRAYSTRGLSAAEVGLLVAFCSMTFTLGNLLLGGLVLMIEPDLIRRFGDLPLAGGRAAALLLVAPPWLYALGSLMHFRPLKIARFRTRLSTPANCGAPTMRGADRTHRRGGHHLLRTAGGEQSRLPRRARGLSRLVHSRPHFPCAGRPWRPRTDVHRDHARRPAGASAGGAGGVPAVLPDPAAAFSLVVVVRFERQRLGALSGCRNQNESEHDSSRPKVLTGV